MNDICGVWTEEPGKAKQLLAGMCSGGRGDGLQDGAWHIADSGSVGLAYSGEDPGECFFYDRENDLAVAFTGRITNSGKISRESREDGCDAPASGSAALVAYLFKRFGRGFIDRVHGYFRIIIWDGAGGDLYAFRDHTGTYPMFFSAGGNGPRGIASRSEMLVASGLTEASLDSSAIYYFLCDKAFAHGETPFAGVRSLRAGEVLHIRGNDHSIGRHYSMPIVKKDMSEAEAADRGESILLELLSESIEHTDAVGILFSGGVDSMLLLSMIKSITDKPIHTYSVIVESASKDNHFIESASKHFGTIHTNLLLDRNAFHGNMLDLINKYPEPSVGGWHVYLGTQAAGKDGVGLVVSGFGGELVFGVPAEYRHMEKIHRVLGSFDPAKPVHEKILGSIAKMTVHIGAGRAPAMILKQYIDLRSGVHKWYDSRLHEESISSLFVEDTRDFRKVSKKYMDDMSEAETGNLSDMLLYSRMKNFEGNKVLGKCNELALRNGVELCTPMLDRRMVEFGFSIPNEIKNSRHVYRKIEIEISRRYHDFERAKAAFSAPMAEWMRSEMRAEALAAFDRKNITSLGIFHADALAGLWESFRSGRSDLTWTDIYSFIALHVWLNRILETDRS